MAAPRKFDDPFWSDLSARMEQKFSLPDGLLRSIVQFGERSNDDAVSPAGARTVFQIIRPTRDAFLKKYGVDAYLSPENAAEVAALHLRDSLQRNAGDVRTAIAEYNASPGEVARAKRVAQEKGGDFVDFLVAETKAYVPRVMAGLSGESAPREQSTYQRLSAGRKSADVSLSAIHEAYKSGRMSAADADSYEKDVAAGKIIPPRGEILLSAKTNIGDGVDLPDTVWQAARAGRMATEDMAALASDVGSGAVRLPAGASFDGTNLIFKGNTPSDVPTAPGAPANTVRLVQPRQRTFGEVARGAAEAASSLVTAPLAAIGAAGGLAGGLAASVMSGEFGTPEGARRVTEAGMQGAASMTFQPGSEAGQEYAAAIGNAGAAIGPQPFGGMVSSNLPATQAQLAMQSRLAPMIEAQIGAPAVFRSNRTPQVMRPNPARAPAEVFRSNRQLVDQVPARRITDVLPADPPPAPAVFRSNRTAAREEPVTIEWSDGNPVARQQSQEVIWSDTPAPPTTIEWSDGVPNIVQTPQRRAGDAGRPAQAAPPATTQQAAPTQAQQAVPSVPATVPAATRRGQAFDTVAQAGDQALTVDQLAALTKTAMGEGMGAVRAREQIGRAAKINTEAKAAAERMGIDVPPDVFSDNPLIASAVGATRSVVASDAEAAWRTTLRGVVDRADDIMAKMDAARDVDSVNVKVKESLGRTRAELESRATGMYREVDTAIPKATPVRLTESRNLLAQIRKESPNSFTPQERSLFTLAGKDKVTYGDLIRERQAVGAALGRKASLYSGVDEGALKRIYGALSQDQMNAVERLAGVETKDKLRAANHLVAKRKALETRIVSAFGSEGEGSIATSMRTALTSAAKGDSKNLSKFLKVLKDVPPELQREAMATAISSISRSARNATDGIQKGDFGLSEYATLYQGLRQNSALYSQVVRTLGPGSHELLRDLHAVSKYVTAARANVLTTGKANQAFKGALSADGLITKVLASTAGRATAAGIGGVAGGPVGSIAATALTIALSHGKKNPMVTAGNLFASQEFKAVLTAASEQQQRVAVKKLVHSRPFRDWAKHTTLPKEPRLLEEWLLRPLQTQGATERDDSN